MSRTTKVTLVSLLLLVFPFALTANAQTTRTYVANSGNDSNLCTASAPCQTITKALSVVDAGGEVIITESGDYDKFVTLKSVTVTAALGVNAGIVSNANNAIFAVLTSTDTVTFRNLNLKAVGDLANSIGIYNSHAGTLNIDGCSITGFETGVLTTNGPGNVFIHDTVVRNNLFGIQLIGPQNEGLLRVVIDHCRLEANDTGVVVSSRAIATIENSIVANQTSRGIYVRSIFANQRAEALIDNCQISNNTSGLVVSTINGGTSVVRLTRSTINSNVLNGVLIGTNGTVYTLHNNTIVGNLVDVNGGQLSPLQEK